MSNLTTRAGKGSPLTNNELDANFTNLNADKVEIGGDLSGTSSAPNVAKIQGRAVSADAPAIGEKLVWNGTAWEPSADPTNEPIGHEDRSSSSISFNSGTRTFTISPVSANFVVWCKGVKYTYTSAQTVVIPDTTGLHFIYFNASGVLSTQMSYFTWEEHAPTAYVYWNATTQQAVYFGDERHGITLDWQTHEYLHRTRGAAIASGFGASGYTTTGAGATDADAQIDIGGGTFFDEDLQVDIVSTNTPVSGSWQQDLSGPARIPVLYLSGSAWVVDAPTNFPFKVVSGVPQYNLYSGGSWSTAPVVNNEYFVSWILATHNLTYPVIAVISQAPTNQLSAAEAMTFEGLNLNGFPSVEFRPLYKVIYQYKSGFTNSVKASTIAVYDIRSIAAAGVAAALVQDHGNLSGLGDDDHAQYLHVSEVRSPSSAVKNSFLPSQASQSGKYLTTDGSNPSWGSIPSGSLTFTGDVTGSGTTGSSTTLTLANSGASAGTYTKVTVDAKGRVTTGSSINSSDVTTALGFTPENSGNKGVANGYASLDGSGKVPSVQLPSYVDDVLEYANLAAFPGTGETGKIYIAIDTAKTYRWSGSAYVEISASPGSTDAVPEGSTNLYFTNSRARGAITATGSLSYNNQTGVLSYTQPTNVSTFTNDSGYLTGITGTQVANALGYTPPQPNGTGATGTWGISITGNAATVSSITSGQVTTALGYTPYNSSNPSGYISGITSSNVTTALGYTPLNRATVTGDWNVKTNGQASLISGGTNNHNGSTTTSGIYLPHSSAGYGVQIGGRLDTLWFRTEENNVWASWRVLLHSGNYTSYSPSLTGSGASGTWAINITGNAATVTNGVYTTGDQSIGGTKTFTSVIRPPAAASSWIGGHRGNSAVWITTLGTTASYHGWISQRTPSGGFSLGTLNDSVYLTWGTNANIDANTNTVFNVMRWDSNGTVVATTFSGALSGNASTATALQTARTINGVSFNGTENITVADSTKLPLSGGTLTGQFTTAYSGARHIITDGTNSLNMGLWDGSNIRFEGGGRPMYLVSYGGTISLGRSSGSNLVIDNTSVAFGGNTLLHAGNYNDYAPSKTGGGASGTWGIGITGTINGITINQERAANPRIYSATTGAMGLLGVNSAGSFMWQLYGEGSTYGLLGSAWGAWDIKKAVNGELDIRVSSTERRVLHAGNYSSYALPLSGGTLSGKLTITAGAGLDLFRLTFDADGTDSWYRAGSGNRHRFTTTGGADFIIGNGSGVATLNGSQLLTAGNYNSYSPTLTGGGASGTWGISISGSAAQLGGNSSSAYSGPASAVKQFFWDGLGANGTQARTFEIARLGIDYNDWNGGIGPFEVELYESYYSRGLKKKYVIYWGYSNVYGIQLVEYSGNGDNNFQVRIGTPVQVSGDNYYLPVFVDVRYYAGCDVRVTTNRDITASNPPGIGQTFINASPSAVNISDFTADSTVNFASTSSVQINGNVALHAANYNSYSPTLTGGGASGTWGISITGNAATAYGLDVHTGRNSDANKVVRTDANGYIQAGWINTTSGSAGTTAPDRIYGSYDGYIRYYTPANLKSVLSLLDTSGGTLTGNLSGTTIKATSGFYHGSTGYWKSRDNSGGSQFAIEYSTSATLSDSNIVFSLDTSGNAFRGNFATAYLHAANYNSYSPSLTGSGASGTWGISVTGSAGSASTATRSTIEDTRAGQRTPNAYDDYRASYEFTNQIVGGGDWHTAFTMQGWHDGYAAWQIIGPASTSAHENWYLRSGVNTTWNPTRAILHAGNYSSYALPLSGGTLTGSLFGTLGSFSGAVEWGSGSSVMNAGNPRSLRIGYSGGNYGAAGYGITFTTSSGVHNYAINDIVSYWEAYDGITVRAAAAGAVGTAVSWTNVLDARRSNTSMTFKGNVVLAANNYNSYSPTLTGGGASGTWGISITGGANTANNSSQLQGLTISQIFNNVGNSHGAYLDFNNIPGYGFYYVQGTGNGPGTGAGQFYGVTLGLGNDYAYSSYAMQLAIPRYAYNSSADRYLSIRNREAGTWGAWSKIHAGYADSAGSVSGGLTTSNYSSYALPLSGGTLTGQLNLHAGSYEGSITFGSSSTWRCGIRQHDDADAELRIWHANAAGMIFLATGYNGEPSAISRPTDGLAIQNNRLGIGNFSSSDPAYKLHVIGDIYATSNVTAYSDERVKTNWRGVGNDFIARLSGVKSGVYDRTDIEATQVGVSAQSLREVIPEAVMESAAGDLSVVYGNAAMVSAVELAKEIVNLKREIEMLKLKIH